MGKRQTRIFAKDLSRHMPTLLTQEVNVLLKNGTVFHGIIRQADNNQVQLTDMLGRKHTLQLQHIAEIISDREALY